MGTYLHLPDEALRLKSQKLAERVQKVPLLNVWTNRPNQANRDSKQIKQFIRLVSNDFPFLLINYSIYRLIAGSLDTNVRSKASEVIVSDEYFPELL